MMSTVQCQNRSFSFNLQCIDAYSSSYCFHCEISARLSPNNSYLPRFSLETFSSCENDTWTCKSIWPLPGISSCLIHTKDSNNLDWLLLFWFDFFFFTWCNSLMKRKKRVSFVVVLVVFSDRSPADIRHSCLLRDPVTMREPNYFWYIRTVRYYYE